MFLRSFHERTRMVGVLLAVGLAFLAQYFFTGEIFTRFHESNTWAWKPENTYALACLAGTMICSAWAFFPKRMIDPGGELPEEPARSTSPGKWMWIVCSFGCATLSVGLYLILGENIGVDGLWLAAIGLFVVPLWLRSRSGSNDEPFTPWWEWALVSGLTGVGFGLRYWRLTEIPSHVDNDVALMGTYAQQLIRSSNFGWVGFSASDHLLSYVQTLAWFMRFFGQDHYGLVMSSVIYGTLTLPLIFLLGRELGGRQTGWIALGLLTVSYTHIHFSRILFGASSALAATVTFYFVFRGLRTRQPVWFALAGLTTSWGMLNYDSGRVIPIVLVSLVTWQWIWQRKAFQEHFQNWVVLGAGIIIGMGPMLGFMYRDFNLFWGRGNEVMLWTPEVWTHELSTYQTTSALEVVWQQVWRTFLTLHLTSDGSPHFGYTRPIVAPLSAALFTLGAGSFLVRFKDLKWFLGLSWMTCTFIFGGVLTADPPYWPHLNVALPGIFLLAALGGSELISLVAAKMGRYGPQILRIGVAASILTTGIAGLNTYYHFVEDNAGPRVRITRYLNSLPSGFQVILFSQEFTWNEYAFRFYNQGIPGRDLTLENLVTEPPEISSPTIFVIFKLPDVLPALQRLYPGGETLDHLDSENQVAFTAYTLTPTGTTLVPKDHSTHLLILPGWWILGLALAAWLARLFFLFQKQRQMHWQTAIHEPGGI